MARTTADLPAGIRLTDHISLGVLAAQFPLELVEQALFETERLSERERALPAHVMVYYVIALALYADVSTREVLRCLREGARWLGDPTATTMPSKSGISQARTRLGAAPLEALYREVVAPVATAGTPGAWYRGWRVMSLDGTTLDVGDTVANARAFGRPASARGVNTTGPFPQLRVVGLLENGTHAICAAQLGAYRTSEVTMAAAVVPHLTGEMLCLADRGLLGFDLWRQASATGAELLWRAAARFTLPLLERFPDGSYRSELRWNYFCTSADRTAIPVRVIEYTLPGVPTPEATYRLVTTVLEPRRAPAGELAALYHDRWEMETAFDEFKTHLRGGQRVLRSKTPDLVRQEAWGFLLAHFAIRALMHEAALGALPRARDPDTLSFTHALRVTRRTLPHVAAIPPSGPPTPPSGAPARAR
ncbi:MAG: IS4 family transposase [Gemmatimonadota bacterium]|nr:IS4 family transposase [Gemmatimonadota bacterium]